jgi:hypothetical protein
MDEAIDRSITISFSLKQSELQKLEQLIFKSISDGTRTDRSKLLAEWINSKFSEAFPEPISEREELDRR